MGEFDKFSAKEAINSVCYISLTQPTRAKDYICWVSFLNPTYRRSHYLKGLIIVSFLSTIKPSCISSEYRILTPADNAQETIKLSQNET